MNHKKAQLHSPLSMGLSIIGIFVILLVFSLTLNFIPEPKNKIDEMEIDTYGNIFMFNFLNYEAKYQNQDFLISALIILFYDNEDPELKTIIENSLSSILKQTTGDDNPCFKLRINDIKEFESSGSCEKSKLKSEMALPYNKELIVISIEGDS